MFSNPHDTRSRFQGRAAAPLSAIAATGLLAVGGVLGSPAASAQPARPAATDPLVAKDCFVSVMTQDKSGRVTYQLLGAPKNRLKAGLGKMASGSALATVSGVRGNGSPALQTRIDTGLIVVTTSGKLQLREIGLAGSARGVKAGRPQISTLGSAKSIKNIAADWDSDFGGMILMNFADGTLVGRGPAGEQYPLRPTKTVMKWAKKYKDLRALSLSEYAGQQRIYAQTAHGHLVRIYAPTDRGGERRVTLSTTWGAMSRPVIADQCMKAQRGEVIFVAADRVGRFHVYSEYGSKVRWLGTTGGRTTGRVL